jgi:acyl-CoA synthetase (NDP forming)
VINGHIAAFFRPRSVVVVGASTSPQKDGHRLLANVRRTYRGPLFVVHPHAKEIVGVPGYPTLEEVPGSVDLVISFVPNTATVQVVRDCAAKGVPAVMILSGGFADSGGRGQKLQQEIVEIARQTPHGMRIWGPNCTGLITGDPPLSTSFAMEMAPLPTGRGAAFIAQSGMPSGAGYVEMRSRGQPSIAYTASIGNRCDVDECDLMNFFLEDPNCDVIALYIESVRSGRRFHKTLQQTTRRKPVVALLAGRTELARKAAMSHTGTLMNRSLVSDALCRQFGVARVDDFVEWFDFTKSFTLLRKHPLRGNRIAIVTHTGAGAVVGADLLGLHGFTLAQFSAVTIDRLQAVFPDWAEVTNPLDIWSTVERVGVDRAHSECLDAVLADPNVDGVLWMILSFDHFNDQDFARIRELVSSYDKPVIGWMTGNVALFSNWERQLESDGGIAFYYNVDLGVRVLTAQRQYHDFCRRAVSTPEQLDSKASVAIRRQIDASRKAGRTLLSEWESKVLLRAAGIGVPTEELVATPAEAAVAAQRIGFPVVLKIVSPDIAHKSDVGAVRVALDSPAAVAQAAAEMLASVRSLKPEARIDGLLVAEMVTEGLEVIAGISRDADFGLVLACGSGGIYAEVERDVSVRVLPVDRAEIERMVDETRMSRLLGMARGKPAGDRVALIDALIRLAGIASAMEDCVAEIDVNPIIVLPDRRGVRALDALVVLRHSVDEVVKEAAEGTA